jgi:peptidoglycan-associated lipoprotein
MTKCLLLTAAAMLCACRPPVRYTYSDPPPPTHNEGTAIEPSKVTVDAPPPVYDPPPAEPIHEEVPRILPRQLAAVIADANGRLEDAFFPYDRSEGGPDAIAALRRDAHILIPVIADFPHVTVAVEGHCDERGSAEYNLALGDRRASQAVAVLQQFGVPASNLIPISFGKEAPQCTESVESCWSRNRRAHLVLRPPQ